MKITFVYAYVTHQSFEENLKVVHEDFGRLPSVRLAYAAAIAEGADREAAIFDSNADEQTDYREGRQ